LINLQYPSRVELISKYIEIPLSISQITEWFAKIEKEDAIDLIEEVEIDNSVVEESNLDYLTYMDSKDSEVEKNAAREYDIRQES